MAQKEVEAKQLADEFINSLSPEQLEGLKLEMLEKLASLIQAEKDALLSLQTQKTDIEAEIAALRETEKTLTDYKAKNPIIERRSELLQSLRPLEFRIMNQENAVNVLANGGDFVSFTDKKGIRHEHIPIFSQIQSVLIAFEEETILSEPLPPYIPLINEEVFRIRGYVFDAIRIAKDEYVLATTGFSEEKPDIHKFVIVTLDQLVLINQYYYTKAKAIARKEADARTARAEQYYDNLPIEKRIKHFGQQNYYRSLPETVKKKITQPDWEALSLEEKEKLYKPFKHYGTKRLSSKLEDDSMWRSFHEMYECFINPEAKPPKPGYGNPETFAYWYKFRDMMKWKIKDIEIQRQALSETRKIALETSFGDSNTNDTLQADLGILIKRQNGSVINPNEVDQIKTGWQRILKTFGNIISLAKTETLKVSHTGQKLVFASKAAGMFVPSMRTIAVSNKFGENQFNQIFAHETAHFIDKKLGERNNRRYATDDYETTIGELAFAFRKNMNAKSESSYTNATKECFARAMEQFFAMENYGDDATLIFSDHQLDEFRKYTLEEDYVSLPAYNQIIKPLILKFLQENSEFLGAEKKVVSFSKEDWLYYKIDLYEKKGINARTTILQNKDRIPDEADYSKAKQITEYILKSGKETDETVAAEWAEQLVIGNFLDLLFNDLRIILINNRQEGLKFASELKEFGFELPENIKKIIIEKQPLQMAEIKKGDTVYDKKGKSIVKRVFKPKKDTVFHGKEEFLLDIKRENGNSAVNMPGSQFSLDAPVDETIIIPEPEIIDTEPKILLPKHNFYVSMVPFDNSTGLPPIIIKMVPNSAEFHTGYEGYDLSGKKVGFVDNIQTTEKIKSEEYTIVPDPDMIYENVSQCLLEDGDNRNDFIIEGSKIFNLEGGQTEQWEIVGFYKTGMDIKHIPKSSLTDLKESKRISFSELRDLFSNNLVAIEGINGGDSKALNLCIKAIKKCYQQIDENKYRQEVLDRLTDSFYKNMPPNAAEELAQYWGNLKALWHRNEIGFDNSKIEQLKEVQIYIDRYFPEYNKYLKEEFIADLDTEKKDGIKLTRTIEGEKTNIRMERNGFIFGIIYPSIIYPRPVTNSQAFAIYEEKAALENVPLDEIAETKEAIELLELILPDLKGKEKKETKEAIELLKLLLD